MILWDFKTWNTVFQCILKNLKRSNERTSKYYWQGWHRWANFAKACYIFVKKKAQKTGKDKKSHLKTRILKKRKRKKFKGKKSLVCLTLIKKIKPFNTKLKSFLHESDFLLKFWSVLRRHPKFSSKTKICVKIRLLWSFAHQV